MSYILYFIGDCCQYETVREDEDIMNRKKLIVVLSFHSISFLPFFFFRVLAPVVEKMDSAIQWINHYPVDKYLENQLRYPVDRDLSGG